MEVFWYRYIRDVQERYSVGVHQFLCMLVLQLYIVKCMIVSRYRKLKSEENCYGVNGIFGIV